MARRHTPNAPAGVGILIDAENPSGREEGSLKTLCERAAGEGVVVYRRAYGDWTTCGKHVSELTRLGFELVQVHHPAPRKNSADVHMTVDAMDLLAQDAELRTFVLATGDSDFAPLFRRLRERRCRVIGVGPRSCLSEAVTSSCVEFLHLGPERPHPMRPRAVRVAPRCAPRPVSAARVEDPHPVVPVPAAQAPAGRATGPEQVASTAAGAWRGLVRLWGWPRVAEADLMRVVAQMRERGPATRAEHFAHLDDALGEGSPARRVYSLILKAGLLERVSEDGAFVVRTPESTLADHVDAAFLARVRSAMAERGLAWDDVLHDWLVGASDPARLARLAARSEAAAA